MSNTAPRHPERRCPPHRLSRPLIGAVAAVTALLWAAPTTAHARSSGAARPCQIAPVVRYRPPVVAPIIDPFRPPATPYGPGNRGIEYATVPGASVRAAADGLVVFAGAVAGGLHVTIRHLDGIRTTYSFLATIRVRQGQAVRGGDVVGLAAAMLHVGARRGDTYIDPASLWGRALAPPEVHLVPLDGHGEPSAPPTAAAERRRISTEVVALLVQVGAAGAQGAGVGVGWSRMGADARPWLH